MEEEIFGAGKRVHFVGIGGAGMSALAKFCLSRGCLVTGSDRAESPVLGELSRLGARVAVRHAAENAAGAEILVYSSAVSEQNPEIAFAREKGIAIFSRAEFLARAAAAFPASVAVAGSHGKTTATALAARVLTAAGKGVTAHIGGSDLERGNFYADGEDIFVTEACEYRKNFLTLRPTVAVLLNLDPDHMECYDGMGDLVASFRLFAERAERAIVNADEEKFSDFPRAATFAAKGEADYAARDVAARGDAVSFTLCERGKALGRVKLHARGAHNVYNALAAAAVGRECGAAFDEIKRGLEGFRGIARRMETVGTFHGKTCVIDYAHHPREIEAALAAFRGKRVRAIFQPHTYSRTKYLIDEFARVLSSCRGLVLLPVYAAREEYDEAGSAAALLSRLPNATLADNYETLRKILEEGSEKILLFLGAGDIDEYARKLCSSFGR